MPTPDQQGSLQPEADVETLLDTLHHDHVQKWVAAQDGSNEEQFEEGYLMAMRDVYATLGIELPS